MFGWGGLYIKDCRMSNIFTLMIWRAVSTRNCWEGSHQRGLRWVRWGAEYVGTSRGRNPRLEGDPEQQQHWYYHHQEQQKTTSTCPTSATTTKTTTATITKYTKNNNNNNLAVVRIGPAHPLRVTSTIFTVSHLHLVEFLSNFDFDWLVIKVGRRTSTRSVGWHFW